ncbi:unnamed protein product, partial [Symbiodinium sp. KB8]
GRQFTVNIGCTAGRARHLASKRNKDCEPAAVGPAQFGVRALFGTSRSEGSSGSTTPSSAWEAGSSAGRDKRCVDCELGATAQRQAIGDDFHAAVVLASRLHIHVPDKHVQSAAHARGVHSNGIWQKSVAGAGEVCATGWLRKAVTPTRTPAGWVKGRVLFELGRHLGMQKEGYLVSTKGPDDRDRQHKLAIDEVDLASELRRLPVFEAPAAEPRQAACRTSGLSGATGVCMETVAGIADGERCCIPVGERLSRERPARCGELAGLDEHGGMCRSAVDVGPVCHGHRGEGQSPRLKVLAVREHVGREDAETKKHLRLMLDDPGDLLFHQAALRFANAETLTSWRKPNRRARALVVGDVRTEAFYKLLQIATECNPRTTVLSVDAVGGHFYGSESSYTYGPTKPPENVSAEVVEIETNEGQPNGLQSWVLLFQVGGYLRLIPHSQALESTANKPTTVAKPRCRRHCGRGRFGHIVGRVGRAQLLVMGIGPAVCLQRAPHVTRRVGQRRPRQWLKGDWAIRLQQDRGRPSAVLATASWIATVRAPHQRFAPGRRALSKEGPTVPVDPVQARDTWIFCGVTPCRVPVVVRGDVRDGPLDNLG